MPTVRRWITVVVIVFALFGVSGCRLFSFLPSTTWKLNRGPALDEGQGYFSIPDPQKLPNDQG